MAAVADSVHIDQAEEAAVAVRAPLTPPELVARVAKNGAHPEYVRFDRQLGTPKVNLATPNAPGRSFVRANFNVWDLINDSVDGTGGYQDGSYLVPHELEGVGSPKFLERQQIARYYNFARIICDGPWNSITSMKDMVVRDGDAHPRLQEFWDDVDGNGTDIYDFLEYPVSQARRFGTGWIFLDRPKNVVTLRQDLEAQPWAYSVPTRNVVWWQYSRAGALESVVYKDPGEDFVFDGNELAPLMVWTRRSYSRWEPTGRSEEPYAPIPGASGPNVLGEVPCVQIFDEFPGRGKGFGKSNMLPIARMGMDVFNRDSEIREIERKCAFPILTVNIEDLTMAAQVTVGTNGVLVYNGKVMPAYLEPMLNSIDKLASERNEAKDAAFVMSEMTGLLGHTATIQTTSGFHSEVEMDKSERRIGRFASSTESAENKIARLFLMLIGEADEDYAVSYPRRFGMVDLDTVIKRTKERLELDLGYEDSLEVLRDYYSAAYPRKTKDELLDLATKAADARKPAAAVMVDGATARQRLGLQRGQVQIPPPAEPPAGQAVA